VELAVKKLLPGIPIIVANSDQYVSADMTPFIEGIRQDFASGYILAMEARGNRWSFIGRDEDGFVNRVVEKEEISEKKLNDTLVEMQREGLNRLYAEKLLVELRAGEVKEITYFDQPDGIFFPMDRIDTKEKFIKGFKWNPTLRPQNATALRKDTN
jgi:hypothetical protein